MVAGLHGLLLPELRASLNMMKFAVYHPDRFHDPKKAFFCGFFRCFMLNTIEIANSFRICGRCNLILVVIGFVSFTALLDVDTYFFSQMSPTLPFKNIVGASNEDCPHVLKWDKSSSTKNSWSDQFYLEGVEAENDDHNEKRVENAKRAQRMGTKTKARRAIKRKTANFGNDDIVDPTRRRIDFDKETRCNKFLYYIFRFWSAYFNGFYFYFLPILVWLGAFLGIVIFN
jgi:hypothetical protein